MNGQTTQWTRKAYSGTIMLSRVNDALLNGPDPERHGPVESEISQNCPESSNLRSIPAKFVVSRKRDSCNNDCRVAKCQSHIGELVRLLEFQGVEVIWEGIVGGILKVFSL